MVKQQSGLISQSSSEHVPQLRPLSQAIAVLLMAGGVAAGVNAQQAFSPAWFANKGAQQQTAAQTGRLPNGMPSNLVRTDQQAQQARETLKTSLENLNTAAQAIAMQQRMQQTARDAARLRAGQVPDGLGEGGLKIDDDALTRGWFNASAPTQSSKDGTTTVSIAQTGDKAILNWETFNVGRNTVVDFDQQASWSLLNRVNDPNARPSQILGRIQGQGTVMLVNRNGVVFDGNSQVNVKNLAASAVNISDAQFRKGLYSDAQGNAFIPTFGNELTTTATSFAHGAATGDVVVERGAQITTAVPTSVTEGGGYVLLLGRQVHNHGQITTANGQTTLAAGDAFVIRKGMGTDQNQTSTTRGNVVTTLRKPAAAGAVVGAASGVVSNSGLIQATTGDITLAGHDVRQQGTLVSTSSVHTRGTVHLLADAGGKVALEQDSTTAIVLDPSATTALDVQRETLVKESDKTGDGIAHRRDQSLVQIVSGGDVDVDAGSLTLATGGQVMVDAVGKSELHDGARVDVSGYVGVTIAMEANNVQINVQGNEQRDAALNRDDKSLNNKNIWLDRRDLVLVPAGTNGYETDRWYTAGGLLEVGGYLGVSGHGIGEWSAQGGTVQFSGGSVVTGQGSRINLSGGALDVQTGYVSQSFLKGADGKLYNASNAPGDLLYSGLYRGFEDTHARWGTTDYHYNPLIGPGKRLENGYMVGRDAGTLVVATGAASLHGTVESSTFQSDRQTRARDAGLDGYQQAQTAVARGGQLVVGNYQPFYDAPSGQLRYGPEAVVERVSIGDAMAAAVAQAGHIALDAAWLNAQSFGGLQAYARGGVSVDQAVAVANGGSIALHAPDVRINADLTARGGSIALGDMVVQRAGDKWLDKPIYEFAPAGYERQVMVGADVTLDARGLWNNQWHDRDAIAGLPYLDGGNVALRSSGSVMLGKGSLIEVSSGAAMDADGGVMGGKGGSVTLAAGQYAGSGVLALDGNIRGYGVKGGGALNIEHGTMISIGGDLPNAIDTLAAGQVSELPLRLAADVSLQPGQVIPVSFTVVTTRVFGGKPLPVSVSPLINGDSPVVTKAPWVLPVSVQVAGNGPVHGPGFVLPAGTKLSTITNLPAGYVLPANVFPDGLPITALVNNYVAGTVTNAALVVPGGTRLPIGTVWQQNVAVQSYLPVDSALFQSGFKNYRVTGRDGVVVVDGARLQVAMPVLEVDRSAARSLASGEDTAGVLSVVMPDLVQDQPGKGKLGLRQGASLSLVGGTAESVGDVQLGQGSWIGVDPGQTISITGNGQISLLGTLQAHGGRISVLGGNLGIGSEANWPNGMPNARSLWVGEQAVLDVSGRAYTGVDADGRRYGRVLEGGTIELGAKHDLQSRNLDAIDAFLVVREGARLDASGSQAVLDLPGLGATTLASAGGVIALSGSNGLFIDGSLTAAAGGAGASGGTLALNLETPVYAPVERWGMKGDRVDDAVRVPRELVIEQHYRGSGLGADVDVGKADPSLAYGHARYGVDAIQAGGFDTASLYVNGLLSFDGDTTLGMRQALYLTASALGLSSTAPRDSQVALSAPYLRMAGGSRRQIDNTLMPNPVYGAQNNSPAGGTLGVPLLAEQARLSLSGNLVDIVGGLGMGASGTIVRNVEEPLEVRRDAFGQLRIESSGDLRLRDADLYSPGHTTLAAAQIYGSGNVTVGLANTTDEWDNPTIGFDPNGVLDIERNGTALPALPYSVFGAMSFSAATVNQGGVLRAPLGSITLGRNDGVGVTSLVNLLPGSITSVSANGLVMPYGGTVDGLSYTHNGVDVAYLGVGGEPKVEFRSDAVDAQAGAMVDLSGGGELTGAAFLSGRGGSTDARLNPLVQMHAGGFVLPGLSTNPVYAIVPGVQAGYAPLGAEKGAGDPAIGRQITLGTGVPGLPAGTYTLLPSTYALLPGAFRVELNGLAASAAAFGTTQAMRNGSWSTSAQLGIANTGVVQALPTQVLLTAADTLRSYSQYNETSYANFALQQAQREGVPRPLLERDAKALNLTMSTPLVHSDVPALRFDAQVLGTPGKDGNGSVARLWNALDYEILADGKAPSAGFDGISVHASVLNAIGASRLEIGGALSSSYLVPGAATNRSANVITVGGNSSNSIVLREGAELRAADVFLMTGRVDGGITLEQGSAINTLGRGPSAYGASQGYIYQPGRNALLAVSNGQLDMLAPDAPNSEGVGAGAIEIGVCAAGGSCTGQTRLYSEGSIATATDNRFVLGDAVRYGTRSLSLAVGAINVGGVDELAAAGARGALPAGMTLNQDVVSRLLLGDTSSGAPALESLSLIARDSVNFFGNVTLSTYDAGTGKSALQRLVLGTPAIYGQGDAGAVARIHTDTLIWTGALLPPANVIAGGPGSGAGTLVVDARDIVFGFGPKTQPDTVRTQERLALGFGSVQLNASSQVTATHKGSLSVYASQGAWDPNIKGYQRSGGELLISTPLLTGSAGSVNTLRAGGDIRVVGNGSAARPDNATLAAALGAEIVLDSQAGNLLLDTTVLLPSGKLSLAAQGDVRLADGARLDLAGRKIDFFDVSKYSWGGDVVLDSRSGDVRQSAGARIDLSAQDNRAGKLAAFAALGTVALDGGLLGSSSGHYDAGGTQVPFSAGRIELYGQYIADFAGLNDRLNSSGVTGGRSFRIGQGDLVIGSGLRAHDINVSLDNGQLTVNGSVDASGEQAGSIRLAASNGVTLAGTAVLDASASVLRKDSYGQVIEAPNRAVIDVDAGQGRLVLHDGARLDLRVAGAAQGYGTVALNAPRVGGNDVAIDAAGAVSIDGARSIQLNAFITDRSAAAGTDTTTDGKTYQSIDQAYLDRLHAQSEQFINAALGNADLIDNRLAGLRRYQDQFRLRPGVQVVSDAAINRDGNLHVDGDIDLSGYRYASLNPHSQRSGIYGSGEAGALVLRAQGDLDVFGSISDGFDGSRLESGFDDSGWYLTAGRQLFGGDVVVPHGGLVTLVAGTSFIAGKVLNYDLPIAAMQMAAGTVLPTAGTLALPLALTRGTVLSAAVHDASGALLYAAGSVLTEAVTLPQGTRLDAGLRLPQQARLAAMTWPAGVALPLPPRGSAVLLGSDLALAKGAIIPAETTVKLPGGVETVNLRPTDANGNQGRTWALAPMLAAGSQSWDISLVAGAAPEAADRLGVARDVRGGGTGNLRFSDPHYGQAGLLADVPGTGSPATYLWGDVNGFERLVNESFGEYVLSFFPTRGSAISAEQMAEIRDWGFFSTSPEEMNDYGYGAVAAVDQPAVPPDKAITVRPGREQLPSVVRTGTGDLRLVSGGDIATTSLFGIYTAGTPSAAVTDAGGRDRYNLPRGVIPPDGRGSINNTVLGDFGGPMEYLVDGGSRSLYQAWYPQSGGNLLLRAGGQVYGDSVGRPGSGVRQEVVKRSSTALMPSSSVSNWLWRQGTGSVAPGADGVATAWWINFGTYVPAPADPYTQAAQLPRLVGFTGFGTLGGGNLVLESAGDAGMLQGRGDAGAYFINRSSGLNLAVASTGRIGAGGALVQTGGGDLDIRIGGSLNADPALRSFSGGSLELDANQRPDNDAHRLELNGSLTNLRGALRLEAGAVGGVELRFGERQDGKETRALDVFNATAATPAGGPILVLGDAAARVDARGDLVLGTVTDPGRVVQLHGGSPFTANGQSFGNGGWSWFSLWTPSTAVDLLAAGGNLSPTLAMLDGGRRTDAQATDGNTLYPSVLRAVAASGSMYYGTPRVATSSGTNNENYVSGVVLAPSPVGSQFAVDGTGQLELMAAGSIYTNGTNFSASGADPTALPSPWNPGFVGEGATTWYGRQRVHNVSPFALAPSVLLDLTATSSSNQVYPLFTFTPPTASGHVYVGRPPSRYYALDGDLVGLRVGSVVSTSYNIFSNGITTYTTGTWYDGGGAVAIRAGRDIVNAGTALGAYDNESDTFGNTSGAVGWYGQENRGDLSAPHKPMPIGSATSRGNLIVHTSADDVSVVEAGRDIRFSTFYVAGPGLLDVSAGRDLYMADRGELRSIGPVANVTAGDRSSGAAIAVAAGMGQHGADWNAFATRYLDAANLADPGLPLAGQDGKVVRVYGGTISLAQWLRSEFGYSGDEAGAEAFLVTQQGQLDQARTAALAAGKTAANRSLAREFKQESQLYLVNWLSARFGGANGRGLHFDAASMDARAFFARLPAEQQSAFLRNVYYAELKAGGREYTQADGPREGSYLRGREAIATLLPSTDANGKTIGYQGDLTMFSSALYYDQFVDSPALRRPKPGKTYLSEPEWIAAGRPSYNVPYYTVNDAGIHTDFGGDISVMVPGGRALVGVDGGFLPGAGSGVLTQGEGDINIYSRGSLLLGQSRIFTTFGGNILAWSAEGDINAGRGSKTTVVYTPQRRVYDTVGNVALSPNTPNTGAGIATLNPIAEVPPGDIDLIAPLGTIDAGEAGIRVSGNVNLAALQVLNAENIQVQGKAVGIPVVAAVNVSALTSASAAANTAVQAAQEMVKRQTQQTRPSTISVQVLGFGTETSSVAPPKHEDRYDPDSVVQVVGMGELSTEQRARLDAATTKRQ